MDRTSNRWISANDIFKAMERQETERYAATQMPPGARFVDPAELADPAEAADAFTTTELRVMMSA